MFCGNHSTASNIGTGLALAFATLGTSVGVAAFVADPVKGAARFGTPISSPDSEAIPLLRAYSARNIASGVGIVALLLTGKRSAVGILIATGTITMALDGWIVAQVKGGFKEQALGHLMFIPVGLLTGWLLMQ